MALSALGNDWVAGINNLLAAVNAFFDSVLPWAALTAMIVYDVFFFFKNRKKRDVFRQEIIWVIFQSLAILVFWVIPELLYWRTGYGWIPPVLRWITAFAFFAGVAWFYGHENGERRWLYSFLGHFGVLFLGWLLPGGWAGVLFVSIPLILSYYAALYILAMAVLPASSPEDGSERWKRFMILASYAWGIQFPILVVADHAWKSPEIRIPGDFTRDYKVPGMIWTKSHQVVGVTGGTQFNRVDGPGVIFTGKLERPFQIIDLRTQLRSAKIEAVSKDGVSLFAIVFAGFRMDPDSWDTKIHARLRAMNPLLQDSKEPSFTAGSFPFSHRRIQAALGTTSVKTSMLDKTIQWDQWALNVITEEVRKIVSQKNLDELWRSDHDKKNDNALDDIANTLKESTKWTLQSRGILLLVSRVVNFEFSNSKNIMDEVSKRQIATWGAEWDRKRSEKLAEAEASAERDQQEARAYAESQLLDSIAEALQKTDLIDESKEKTLKQHVIAMRYLSALQDYAHKNTPEEEEQIKELHNSIRGQ